MSAWHPCSSPPEPGLAPVVLRDDNSCGGYAYTLATYEPQGADNPPEWRIYHGDRLMRGLPDTAEWMALETEP